MNAFVQKWGNSLALRIPSALAKDIHLEQGAMVGLSVSRGAMMVKPKKKNKASLAKMLKKISKKNIPHDEGFGSPAGKEIW